MTTPAGSGAADTSTPTRGGALPVDGSGYGGADREDAPDVRQGRMHVPGEAPQTVVLDGPAAMPVRKSSGKSKSSKSSDKK